jgi:UDP-N-acetylenolpyruvoylglucosamine reductase
MNDPAAMLPQMGHPPQHWASDLRQQVSCDARVVEQEPLSSRTTLRVGGKADVWVEPANVADLSAVLAYASERAVPVMVFGRGSNLVVRDGGIRGIVISLAQPWFSRVMVEGCQMRCGAGARLKAVAIAARKQGLAGMEFLEGIPGSVGGALRMNAGAHGRWIFDVIHEVRFLDPQGKVHVMPGADMGASYRSCPRLESQVAVEAVMVGVPDAVAAIDERMRQLNQKRWSSQPAAPSAGCMFKNPESIPAGRLVEELGLKGARVGGAMVSGEHGNFIVTDGTATAADVLQLMSTIQEEARSRRGIHLQPEVQIVGEDVAP